jgi:hypothetical protein
MKRDPSPSSESGKTMHLVRLIATIAAALSLAGCGGSASVQPIKNVTATISQL